MKDLYTFDSTSESALDTYETVRQAYTAFFEEFKVPFLVARAASGQIGGDLSHEYHFNSSKGEDNTITCSSCDYVANEELAERDDGYEMQKDHLVQESLSEELSTFLTSLQNESKRFCRWLGITRDRITLVEAILPRRQHGITEANAHALKDLFPDLDTSVEDPLRTFVTHNSLSDSNSGVVSAPKGVQILRVFDRKIPTPTTENWLQAREAMLDNKEYTVKAHDKRNLDLLRIATGDRCAKCEDGTLKTQTTVELGHTFYLGTRYSRPLNATVTMNQTLAPTKKDVRGDANTSQTASIPNLKTEDVPMQMGCHGIGVSRLIAAVADILQDSQGLNWPRVMAPFEAVIISSQDTTSETCQVYDQLALRTNNEDGIDCIIDDRQNKGIGFKFKDADLNGYPVIVVVGRGMAQAEKTCEVQCRRLGVKSDVPVQELKGTILGLLAQL